MNWDQIKGEWLQLKGSARERWGEMTDDELQEARGEREQLIGLVQSKYGKARAEAEAEVDAWHAELKGAA
ncbi:CsbD family protein [Alphaproteobacteria bacterium GH1-50]|uniref:CsbD family protein n=1 Tax=Kangsaoukella pontilimi TaxID=2691042 RepID=A0A7C9MFE6_9RHOB|nr:CsbD family protein [Kangsaoukella pontilimi]MXQ08852.1 CsbD family protein [Kangsaoukella pontilimi]